jgi:hypothetical protein
MTNDRFRHRGGVFTGILTIMFVLALIAAAYFAGMQWGNLWMRPVPANTQAGESAVLYVYPPSTRITAGAFDMAPTSADSGPGTAAMTDLDALWQRQIATHTALIGNRANILLMINDANNPVRQTEWFKGLKNPAEAYDALVPHLRIGQMPGTAMIEVRVEGIEPKEAAKIANEIVNVYLETTRRWDEDTDQQQIAVLNLLQVKLAAQRRRVESDLRIKLALAADAPTTQPADVKPVAETEALKLEIEDLQWQRARQREQYQKIADRVDQFNAERSSRREGRQIIRRAFAHAPDPKL